MKWNNDITKLLAIEYPIIQAPMYGVTTPKMVAAATKANCLGSLSLGDLPGEKCIELIRETKLATNNDFAVNIFANKIPILSESLKTKYIKTKQFVENLALQNNLHCTFPDIEDIQTNSYQNQIEALLSEKCKIVSFTFGNLDAKSIEKFKNIGTKLIGTCTSVEEAKVLENSGIDILCVQGIEAGGHRGSFLDEEIPTIGGLSLLSQVKDCTSIPLIYAGGIYNPRTLLAAKTLGASGFQIGSLLLGSAESALLDFEKNRLREVNENEIVLTKGFSGRYARGINNKFIKATQSEEYVLPYPYQNKLTASLRKKAKETQNLDFVSIWLGQSISEYSSQSTTEILQKLIVLTEQFTSTEI